MARTTDADEYQSLSDLCRDGDIVGVQRELRWGPFATSDARCAPPSPPPPNLTWMRIDRLVADEESMTLATVLGLIGGTGATVHIAIGAGRGEAPTMTIGVDASETPIAWVQSLASPAVQMSSAAKPHGPSRSLIQGGIVARLGLGTDPDASHFVGMLEPLLTIPDDDWWLYVVLHPSNDGSIDRMLSSLQHSENQLAAHASVQLQQTDSRSTTWVRSDVKRSLEWLDVLQLHGSTARAAGGWLMNMWAGAARLTTIESIAASLGAATATWGGAGARWTIDRLAIGNLPDPNPTSFISNEELARIFRTPTSSTSTVRVVNSAVAGRRVPGGDAPIELGYRLSTSELVALDLTDFEGHVFITGTTGSGKTTTTHRLLADLWNRHRIPFLVVDPVKDDYTGLDDAIEGGIRVVRSRALRLNVLEPWSNFDAETHTDSVAALFKASFSMPSPIPYVADRLFRRVNRRLAWGSPVSLHDLRDDLDDLVASLGYSSEIESNIRAALGTRLDLLLDPHRADLVAAPDNRQLTPLLDQPSVITLNDIADPDARGFVMALVALLISERARTLGPSRRVRHVTVLEEAHTVMPQVTNSMSAPESGNSAAAASKLLSGMLAELRAFGESVVVVDQSPSSVDREVVKNTNLKVAHRILDPADRDVVGGSLGLDEEDGAVLGALGVGEAVVTSSRILEPVMVKVTPGHRESSQKNQPEDARSIDTSTARSCCAITEAAAHHHSEQRGAIAEDAMAHYVAGMILGEVDAGRLKTMSTHRLSSLTERYPGSKVSCLAYIGLRRAVSSYASLGLVPPTFVGPSIRQLWEAWQNGRDTGSLRTDFAGLIGREVGPHAGCVTCTNKCTFRALTASIRGGGVTEARRLVSMRSILTSSERLPIWAESASRRLATWIGDHGDAAVRCSLIQAMEHESTSWAETERVLASVPNNARDGT